MEQRFWPRTHDELNESPIQVRVGTVDGIFNPMDPSPLEERSLNPVSYTHLTLPTSDLV